MELPRIHKATPAEYSATPAMNTVTTRTYVRRTTTRKSVGTTEGNLAGRRTAAVEDATVEKGVAAALQLTVDATGGGKVLPSYDTTSHDD